MDHGKNSVEEETKSGPSKNAKPQKESKDKKRGDQAK